MTDRKAAAKQAAHTRRMNEMSREEFQRWEAAKFPDKEFEGATMLPGVAEVYREELEKQKAAGLKNETKSKPTSRLLRADDFIAESLEVRAAHMPEGIDREQTIRLAELFRDSGRTGMVRVWEK